jgi:Cu+-exporting ATPase
MAECCHGGARPAVHAAPAGARYTCPMHPEVVRDGPGDCPKCGMALEPMGVPVEGADEAELRSMMRRLVACALLTAPVFVLAMAHVHGAASMWFQAAASGVVLFWGGWPFLRRAWQSLVNRSANMFTLIATGTLAAWFFSMAVLLRPAFFGGVGVYFEAAAVIITLVLAGQVLELRARRRTGDALRALMDLAPATAWKVTESGGVVEVPLPEVTAGDRLRVRAGDKVPVDGEVVSGSGVLDESMLTGESVAVVVERGRTVRAGTLNHEGSFDLQASAVGSATLLAQIVELVAQAQRGRAPVQDLADRVSAVFVPLVVAASVVTFAVWMLAGGGWAPAVTNAVAVLIIACPCAIGLAVPMSLMVGIGRAARAGVLVRQPAALERLGRVGVLCVDKTGTLTEGRPRVERIEAAPDTATERVLALAASLAAHSGHPLAGAIARRAEEDGVALFHVDGFASTPGGGMEGDIVGVRFKAGTAAFAGADGGAAEDDGLSRVVVSERGRWLGSLRLEDAVKPSALEALKALRQRGLRVVMLTGDRESVAQRVARQLGVEDVRAGLLPGDKAAAVSALQSGGAQVCMAGDGVNDAPALAAADTGIAMGAGSDVAKETADFVLVHGSLEGVVRVFHLGDAITRNVRQNLFLAFAYNTLGIPLAAGVLYPFTGWLLSPMLAGAAMSLSSVSVIANALRLARVRV